MIERSPLARKYVGVKRRKKMMDEIEELWSLADECREWERAGTDDTPFGLHRTAEAKEFKRLAEKIDWIARRLAARMPT